MDRTVARAGRWIAFWILLTSQALAQVPDADSIQTSDGLLIVRPVEHASFVLSLKDKTIYVDPTGKAQSYKGARSPDILLITDIHGDHFDQSAIDAVKTGTTIIIAPKAVADKLTGVEKSRLVALNNGEHIMLSGISITAVPMYNLPENADSRHTKGRGNGYTLAIGGKRVYISGDTEDIPEMRALKNIDMAFVCMNLPYTMDIRQAASAVLAFKPRIVYPYHYRGQGGLSDVAAFKELVNAGNKQIRVRLLNWYPAK